MIARPDLNGILAAVRNRPPPRGPDIRIPPSRPAAARRVGRPRPRAHLRRGAVTAVLACIVVASTAPLTALGSHRLAFADRQFEAPTTPPAAAATGWELVRSDDFDGTAVDTTKWSVYGPWIAGHAGNGIRSSGAITVGGGLLTITAKMVNGTLVSGGMSNRYDQTYGKFEFRVRTDADPSQATSGVVLTWPGSGRWPLDGENDIYETGIEAARNPVSSYVHYGSTNQQYWFHHPVDGTAWHTYAMEWTPSTIRILRDGALVWTVSNAAAIPDVAHHLAIQLDAFKKSMSGTVRMQVDWVRIYRPASGADITAPTTSYPAVALASGVSLDAGRPTLRLRWAAADSGTGVHHVEVAQSTDRGAFVRIASQAAPWTLSRQVSPGHTYRFRVRAIDAAGNVGAWRYGPITRVSAISQSNPLVRYSFGWLGSTSSMWWGGTARTSSRFGSAASFVFTGRSIAWVSVKDANRGKARVYVNGVLKATVDLYSPTALKQRVVWSMDYSTSATRVVRISVLGTPGRPRVDLDGFIVRT